MRMIIITTFTLILFPLLLASEDKLSEIKPNLWMKTKLEYTIPDKFKSQTWDTTDGFCDTVYRSKTGTIISRTGIISDHMGIFPGYYSNTMLEWSIKNNSVEVIDVSNWGGGSGGKGKLLPGFNENPSPSPRHTYDGMAYDSDNDALYLMCGAFYKTGGSEAEEDAKAQLAIDAKSTWRFTFGDRKWERIDGNIRKFWSKYSAQDFEPHLEYWPSAKKLIYLDGGGKRYAEFDIKSEKWEKKELNNQKEMSLFGARSAWDSKRELWVFRLGDKVSTFDPKERKFSLLPLLPEKFAKVEEGRKSWHRYKSIAYISKYDSYIITGETGNDTYIYQYESNSWAQVMAGDLKLPNGYLEFDEKSETIGLVVQKTTYILRYDPSLLASTK